MPPEPLPWDRKDFFKERKQQHERPSLDTVGPASRWRETPPHHGGGGGRDFGRWGSAEFRSRPPGHGKQGGWHLYSEESGHGFTRSRSNEKIIDDESFRPSDSRADGKYGRNGRENRGSFSQKDWKCHSRENGGSPNGPGRSLDASDQRSVDGIITVNSHPHSDFVNTWDHDKTGGVNGLGTGQRFESENSLGSIDWKPLKWARSGSMCSRGSGLSNSSSSKSMGVDSSEARAEAQMGNVTPVQSPSGDVVACATSAVAPSEETSAKKKPRLGWGEGLAKYEKKKVDGPDDIAANNEAGYCGRTEPLQLQVSNLAGKSPRIGGFSDCASPATPSSVACSSSPGVEDKSFVKATSIDNVTSNLCVLPNLQCQSHLDGRDFNLENLELTPISNLSSSISELLQTDDPGSVGSSFARSAIINKLLVWKGNISKELEVTESEIESLEIELKSLISESGKSCPCPAGSSSLLGECVAKPCEELVAAANIIPRPSPLLLDSSGDMIVERADGGMEDKQGQAGDEDVDSPGTVTSKFVGLLSSTEGAAMSDPVTCGDVNSSKSGNFEMKCSLRGSNEEKTCCASASEVGYQLIASKSSAPPQVGISSQCYGDDMLYDQIVASNKGSASRASEVLDKLLPSRTRSFCSWASNAMIQEKFVKRKRFLKFRERVITLKFRAMQHLWKEDMRLLSIKKNRAKSQKRLELILRTQNGSYQKHRSSIRSRFASPVGNSRLIPTTEVINFTSKLLLDSQVKPYRDSLKMPALILDEKEKKFSKFVSWNCLVEDPVTIEKERAMINPWSLAEKEVFLDKLTTFGKDFRRIASFLDHKTIADCIEFYYKNHKSDCFEKTKKKPDFGGQGKSYPSTNYLVTSGKRWNRQINAASLDMLGVASAIAANADDGTENQQKCTSRFVLGLSCGYRAPRGDDVLVERSGSLDRETAAADVLAGICGSLSSEAMSSCVTSSFDPVAVGSLSRRPLTPEVAQSVEDDTCSDESCGEIDHTDWTDEEKSVFIQAVSSYGKDFAMISRCMRTRSREQCKVFFSKARKCLGLDGIGPRPSGEEGVVLNDNANGGGGSDNGSVICDEKSSGPKMGEETILSDLNIIRFESDPAETMNLQSELDMSEDNNGRGLIDCKLEKDVDGDSKMENGVDDESVAVGPLKDAVLPPDIEVESHEASGDDSSSEPVSAEEVETVAVCQHSADSLIPEPVGQLASEDNLMNEQDENGDANISGPIDLHVNVNASDAAADANVSVGFGVGTKQEQETSVEMDPKQEHLHVSLEQEQNVSLVNTHSATKGTSTLDIGKVSEKQCVKPPSVDDYNQHQSSHGQILMGYPIPTSTKRDVNGDTSSKKMSFQSFSNVDRSFHSDTYLSQEYFLQKCNGSKPESSVAELPFVSQEQKGNHSRAHSWSSSDPGKKPSGNGDVKLFGQILTHTSSTQSKQNSTGIHENEDKGVQIQLPKLTSNNFNQKLTGTNSADASSVPKMFDQNNYRGLENVPIRSYGYWDGNRIQTGFSALPDSAILLAKYPAAFSNYSTTPTNMEQQTQLHSVVKGNERNLNSVSLFSSSSNNGVAEYLLHRNREGARVQPFTVDIQPQPVAARGVVGINVVGRGGGGGILVGGVSDPVAAIKMHYAKTEHFNGQMPGVVREEESWRGGKKGDIGR
ncbi:hypothetical protein RHMOL_Rhmol09G0213300 [Rhododendron molle]|uniref:Uncharacterized protein n=1 Tax=Rhododendron molle TaxID=49168 RepID=A0ACC0MHK7_RHOML|nr:hypothetical protein RHMOL_Rhmol09G0213300 [Rhododendron molle]